VGFKLHDTLFPISILACLFMAILSLSCSIVALNEKAWNSEKVVKVCLKRGISYTTTFIRSAVSIRGSSESVSVT